MLLSLRQPAHAYDSIKDPENLSRLLCLYSLFSCVYKLLFNHLMTLVLTKQWQMKRNVFVDFLLFFSLFSSFLVVRKRDVEVSSIYYFWNGFCGHCFCFDEWKWVFQPEQLQYSWQPRLCWLVFLVYQSVLFTFVNWFPLSEMSSVALETGRIVATKVATFSKSTNKLHRYYVNNAVFFSLSLFIFGLYEIGICLKCVRFGWRLLFACTQYTDKPFYGNEAND